MIIFTCDIDWAPEEVIADTLSLFEQYKVKCTIFATHKSGEISKCNRDLFEVGIHPNFNFILGGNPTQLNNVDKILDEILTIYPDSKGVRSHSMVTSTGVLSKFVQYNLKYDVNIFLPYHSNIKPFKLWSNFIRVPYNWEDDVHWMYGYPFSETRLDLKAPLNVLDFHPIHVFLNTESQKRYDAAKKYYKSPTDLETYKNVREPGTRDLLIDLLKMVRLQKTETVTISKFLTDFENENPDFRQT